MSIRFILTTILFLVIAVLWIVPLIWMADTALKPSQETFSSPPRWIPSHLTLGHVKELFNDFPYFSWFYRSVLIALLSTGGSLIVSGLAAFSFARLSWRGRDTLFMILLVFMLLPWQINIIPLFFTAKTLNLLNTVPGVALPIMAMPIGVFLLRQFFINIPKNLEEAARMDGCTSLGILLRIIVPMSRPAFMAYGIFMFNWAWNEFFWSSICLQRPKVMSLPVGLRHLQGAMDIDYNLFMAAAFITALPTIILFLVLRKQIIRGFTLAGSGIKG